MAANPVSALACTQVYVGNQLTTDGDTYWGRSEDYSNRYGKAFGIAPATKNGKTIQSYENDTDPAASFSCQIDGPTLRYTFVRDTPDNWTEEGDENAKAYSEAGTNEKGVSITATLSTDYNEKVA
jgi:dipeptidase